MSTEQAIINNVHIENVINSIITTESNRIIKILSDFIGKKVVLKDNQLSKKVKDLLNLDRDIKVEPLTKDGFASLQAIFLDIAVSSLWLKVSLCFNVWNSGENAYYYQYVDDMKFIASFNHKTGELTSVSETQDFQPINVNEEIELYHKTEKAKMIFEELNDKLNHRNRIKCHFIDKNNFR